MATWLAFHDLIFMPHFKLEQQKQPSLLRWWERTRPFVDCNLWICM